MTQGGPALAPENGPSIGRGMGENTSNERAVRTGPDMQAMKDMPSGTRAMRGHGHVGDARRARLSGGHDGHDGDV